MLHFARVADKVPEPGADASRGAGGQRSRLPQVGPIQDDSRRALTSESNN